MKLFRTQKLTRISIGFFVIFYLVWTVAELVIHPAMNQVIPDGSILSQLLFDGIIKNLCWTVPALMLINQYDDDLYLKKPDLFRNPVSLKQILPIFGYEAAFCVLNSVISHRGFYFRPDGLKECVGFLFVGITEELVFRGFLLNAAVRDDNQYQAAALNAVLFLSIHFPIWILYGNFVNYFTNFGFVTILMLSAFFSWAFLEFKNIWVPVGLHMLWDILVTILN